MSDFLQQAYMATSYHIVSETVTHIVKINAINPEFNSWCKIQNITSWAFITAWNPLSKELTNAENTSLNTRLKEEIIVDGYGFDPGSGVPVDDNWEPEDSFFIHNITLERARELGSRFRQNAIVFGEADGLPRLIWLPALPAID